MSAEVLAWKPRARYSKPMDYLDWFVPPESLDDSRMYTRHRGIAKALLTISLVVSVMMVAVALLRGHLAWAEYVLFAGCILTPVLGALLIRATSSITLGLVATNLGGIVVVTAWAWLSGGILSIALPAFLANIALLGTFGNVPILIAMGAALAAALLFLYVSTVLAWLPPSMVVAADLPGLMLTAMLGSAGIVVLAGYFLARDRALVKARLHDARLAAEQSSRAKAAFLRSMSQEFRAPLEAILGQAEALRAALPGDAREQQSLQGIVIAGQYLGDLLNQLLEMGRVEADETSVRIEPVAVAEIVAPCLAIIRPELEKRHLALTDDCGELGARKVWADRVLVRQVVLNLLTNAGKFNREGGSVAVSCQLLAESYLRIVVADTGAGIAKSRQRELFEPFSRLGLQQGSVHGAGLGLVMSKRLIERMRGRIAFDSIEGMGSSFWIDLPLADVGGS
jgi:signal transduction histidine kinase